MTIVLLASFVWRIASIILGFGLLPPLAHALPSADTLVNPHVTWSESKIMHADSLVGENNDNTIYNHYGMGGIMTGNKSCLVGNSFEESGANRQGENINFPYTRDAPAKTTTQSQPMAATKTDNTESDRWSEKNWNFGSIDEYPAIMTYRTNTADPSIQEKGWLICNQPEPRSQDCRALSLVATSPATFTSGAYDFGAVVAEDSSIISYTLTGANLNAENITITLDGTDKDAFDFSPKEDITPNVDGSLPNNRITVVFNPTEVRAYTATITHSGGELANPIVLTLTGEGIEPPVPTLTPTLPPTVTEPEDNAFNFGKVRTDMSHTFTYVLEGSTLNASVPVTLALGGADASTFSISPANDIMPNADGSLSNNRITVVFNPTEVRTYTATITHSGGGISDSVVLTLMGEGIVPTLTLTPTLPPTVTEPEDNTFNFGKVRTDMPRTFTYALEGSALTTSVPVALALGGTDASIFSISPANDIMPNADGSLPNNRITVAFNPTEVRAYTATITHSGGGISDSVVLTLMGEGMDPPVLTLTLPPTGTDPEDNAFNFGKVRTTDMLRTFTYILEGNALTASVPVALALGGADASTFSISPANDIMPNADGTLPNNRITVAFNPTEERSYMATIIHSGGGISDSVVLTLMGEGIVPTLTLTPTLPPTVTEPNDNAFNFGKVRTDMPRTFTYILEGSALTASVPVALALGGTDVSIFSISPANDIMPNADGSLPNNRITVVFNPTEARSYTATITHSGGGISDSVVLTLMGEGIVPTLTLTPTLPPTVTEPEDNAFNFGKVRTDMPRTFTYILEGNALTASVPVALALGGTDVSIFSISPANDIMPNADGTLPNNRITVAFNPTEARAYMATITHSGGGISDSVMLTLTGEGIVSTLTLTPTLPPTVTEPNDNAFNFGKVRTTDMPLTFTYILEGNALNASVPLVMALGGADASIFSISPANDIIPNADGSLPNNRITVAFNPTEARAYMATITHSGGGISDSVVLTLTGSGIKLNNQILEVEETLKTIYLSPNPVSNRLLIQGNGKLQVLVCNILGATLLTTELIGAGNVDLTMLPAGVYLVSIQDNTGRHTQRILKQ